MEVSDIHVGKQLQVNYSVQGSVPNPPLCFGFGASAVPGTGFFNGGVLVGSPLNFPIPNVPEATLMVGRPEPTSNPLASRSPSIFKITNKGSKIPPSPIDVILGEPGKGMVGISANSEIINIVNATIINIKSPITNGDGVLNWSGAKTLVGAESLTGAKAQNGAEARSGGKTINGSTVINGALVVNGATHINGFLSFSGSIVGTTKKFDIPHPTKKNHRLAHVCLEGPEAGVYYRGRLINNNVIELPDYWLGLIDPETITVNLTPHESYQELYVKSIEWGKKINILNNAGGAVNCSYVVYAERIDIEKLVVEYEGTEPKE